MGCNAADHKGISHDPTIDRTIPNLALHIACDAAKSVEAAFVSSGDSAVKMAVFHGAAGLDPTGEATDMREILYGSTEVAVCKRQVADAAACGVVTSGALFL